MIDKIFLLYLPVRYCDNRLLFLYHTATIQNSIIVFDRVSPPIASIVPSSVIVRFNQKLLNNFTLCDRLTTCSWPPSHYITSITSHHIASHHINCQHLSPQPRRFFAVFASFDSIAFQHLDGRKRSGWSTNVTVAVFMRGLFRSAFVFGWR